MVVFLLFSILIYNQLVPPPPMKRFRKNVIQYVQYVIQYRTTHNLRVIQIKLWV